MELKFGDEIIKPIKNFEKYGISNKGYVYRNLHKGLLEDTYKEFRLKTFIDKNGLHKVQLSNKNKKKVFYIHRLVAEYFIPNPHNYKYVIHLDQNKNNNSVNNLKWTNTPIKKTRNKIINQKILELYKSGKTPYAISKLLNISIGKVMKEIGKKDILSITIKPDLKENLIKISEKKGIPISLLIEKLILKYIKEEANE